MATAISKPASQQPPKVKRPPPPFSQTTVNGIKQSPSASSSPAITSKRLPGTNQPSSNNSVTGPVANGVNNRPINKMRKDSQKPGDSLLRSQRPSTRNSVVESDRRATKIPPEPFVKTTSYILKRYSKAPPSLTIHLHPTHFRFEQQDGSFPYNSEMKVIIEHLRSQTVPHDMMEELLCAGVKFYEGCLIVKVVDHKSVSAQTSKSNTSPSDEKNTPFSIHNYNQHVTPSPYMPYPKQNQVRAEKVDSPKPDAAEKDTGANAGEGSSTGQDGASNGVMSAGESSAKQQTAKPKVYTTVLHPTSLSIHAELTYLSTTPHPLANANLNANKKQPTTQGTAKASTTATGGPPPPKRQKMLVDPEELPEFESKLIRAVAPPLYLEPVDSFESAQQLLQLMESPLHRDKPPSPKTRKRTVAELAADEALAAEEERFMLIMDERLEPATSGAAGGPKSAVDDTAGAVPFEPRFSRFKTIENIRIQHEEKAKREHEQKIQQEHAKRLEQDKERRRIMEQRQAEEHAKEERRQQLVAQQAHAQAQLAAQQQQQRLANGLSQTTQGQMSSPIVRNQTPHNMSSPVVSNTMAATGGSVPMNMTASAQGAGSPQRPPSTMQHAHPGVMSHPMAASRSQQQSQSRNGTPQMAQGTPAMGHATPVMRNVTPTQRMGHSSPPNSSMAQTPVMSQSMMGTPQMAGAGLGLTPQQQQLLLQQQRQQFLAQQGLTPQQIAQMQATQNIKHHQHQQQLLQQQQQFQQGQQQMQQNVHSRQAYQAKLMRTQMVQMQMAAQQSQNSQQQAGIQLTPQQQQQQQMLLAAQANGGQASQNVVQWSPRHQQVYQQKVIQLRHDLVKQYGQQYGSPQNFPPQLALQYSGGVEKMARAYVMDMMRKEQAAIQQAAMMQHQQQQMMANGMGK